MTFFASFLVFFSSAVCARENYAVAICALLCLLLSFAVYFLDAKTVPKLLYPLFALSFFLRLLPLWSVFEAEPGGTEAPILFALAVAVVALIAADKKEKRVSSLLTNAAVPFSLLALLLVLFCLCGRFALPQSIGSPSPVPLLTAFACPLSSVLLLPRAEKWFIPPLAALLSAGISSLLLMFSFPLWEGVLTVVVSPVCAACELRMLLGKTA